MVYWLHVQTTTPLIGGKPGINAKKKKKKYLATFCTNDQDWKSMHDVFK